MRDCLRALLAGLGVAAVTLAIQWALSLVFFQDARIA